MLRERLDEVTLPLARALSLSIRLALALARLSFWRLSSARTRACAHCVRIAYALRAHCHIFVHPLSDGTPPGERRADGS
jgi:hypothetical protein